MKVNRYNNNDALYDLFEYSILIEDQSIKRLRRLYIEDDDNDNHIEDKIEKQNPIKRNKQADIPYQKMKSNEAHVSEIEETDHQHYYSNEENEEEKEEEEYDELDGFIVPDRRKTSRIVTGKLRPRIVFFPMRERSNKERRKVYRLTGK